MSGLDLVAAVPMGLEAVVGRELKELGYADVAVENGRVLFSGQERDICRANLWLRTADRVQVRLGEFRATTFDELFEGTKALPWDEWIPADGRFIVEGKSHQSQLSSVPACQSVTEKALVERLKQRHGLDWFPKTGARYTVQVALLKDVATLTLDTTGPSLHKRGYRKLTAAAPIKETLAAALILLSRWHPERPFLDPFCGSGTIPIEAALIGHRMAPGLHREFDAQRWGRVHDRLWQEARDEAHDLVEEREMEIIGSDLDPEVLELARHHLRSAGLSRSVRLWQRPVAELSSGSPYGYLITNPPYGERISDHSAVEALYREFGKAAKRLQDWSIFCITAHQEFERHFGRRADKKRKLYNGRIETTLYQYLGSFHARPVPHTET